MSKDQGKSGTRKLTDQQELFCQEYLKDLNGTRAAQRAGFSPDNERAAAVTAAQFLRKPNISARIQSLKAAQAKRLEIDADTILRELHALATVDITEAFDDSGKLKDLRDIPPLVRKAISHLEVVELFNGMGDQKHAIGLTSRLKFYDKTKALELLGKHLKIFTEKHEHSGPDGKPIETKNLSELPTDQLDAKIKAMIAKESAS
jgi:phage terminase small subunit